MLTRCQVITQVFPDEFHLNTLDQLLSAIARLNPHVNVKAIVIGLMDRLSAYAARQSESEPPETRRKTEEEATAMLLEKLRISKESKSPTVKADQANSEQTNGTPVDGDESVASPSQESNVKASDDEPATSDGDEKLRPTKSRGIPENVKLYEIFYEQVINLVNAQRLPIQDTTALLVSLANLALLVPTVLHGMRNLLTTVAIYTLNV